MENNSTADITDRYLSSLRAAGLVAEIIPTGGNCDAIEVTAPNRAGIRFLVTDDAQVPDTEECVVGAYDANDEPLDIYAETTVDDLAELLTDLTTLQPEGTDWETWAAQWLSDRTAERANV